MYQESYVSKNLCKNISLKYLNENEFINYIENQTSSKVSHSSKKIYFKGIENQELIKTFNDDSLNGFIIDEEYVYRIFGELIEYRKSYKPKYFKWNFMEWIK